MPRKKATTKRSASKPKSRSSSKKRTSTKSGSSSAARVGGAMVSFARAETTRKAAPGVFAFCAVILLGLGSAWAVAALETRVESKRALPTFTFDWPVEPEANETWLSIEFRERVEGLANEAWGETSRPFDREPLTTVGDALANSGWFEDRPTVQRVSESEIKVSGAFRRPVVVVDRGAERFLVTESQRVLNDGAGPLLDQGWKLELPVIIDIPQSPPTRASGEVDYLNPWESPELEAAIALAIELSMRTDSRLLMDMRAISAADADALYVVLRREEGSSLPRSRAFIGPAPGKFDPAAPGLNPEQRIDQFIATIDAHLRGPTRDEILRGGITINPATGGLQPVNGGGGP